MNTFSLKSAQPANHANDATKMPYIQPYLDSLSDGFDSHPEAMCKASMVRTSIAEVDIDALKEVLPPLSVEFLESLPRNSAWVPEVHAQVLFLGMNEVLGEDLFLERAKSAERKVFSNPLYKPLFLALSASHTMRLVAGAWGRFHRGSRMKVVLSSAGTLILRLEAPKDLFSPVIMRTLSFSCATALEITGVKDIRVKAGTMTPWDYTFQLSWGE